MRPGCRTRLAKTRRVRSHRQHNVVVIRNVFAALAGLLLACLAVTAVLGFYDLASIYGDPIGSEFAFFREFGIVGAIALVLMLAAATLAVTLARGRARPLLMFFVVGVFTVTVPGIVVANHYGHEAKRQETASPPTCGIRNSTLDAEFRRLDHAGYFGGGGASRVSCSYLLSVDDTTAALNAYEERLTGLGYEVRRSPRVVEATSEDYRFRINLKPGINGGDHVTVTLRERAPTSPGSVL
jgi:hypothetical protein